VIASAVATVGFGCRGALRALDRRERVCDLIISGRGDVPLAVAKRERGRLLDPCRRETLAHCYESLGEWPAWRPGRGAGLPDGAREVAEPS
jgi:hypothetical protein